MLNFPKSMSKLNIIQLGCILFITALALFALGMFMLSTIFNPGISDEQKEEIKNEILEKQSILTFKETFSDHREKFDDNNKHRLTYTIQAYNTKTGNTLSLFVEYYAHHTPFEMGGSTMNENITCEPNHDKVVYQDTRPFYSYNHNMENLFMDEKILNSTCLDNDWEPTAVVLKENTR